MKKLLSAIFALLILFPAGESNARERLCLDKGWKFAFGNASDPEKDFGRGTEYFNYFTKANSIHNTGPYSLTFKADTTVWKEVELPHDFVVGLPFDAAASHSHGYKTVGWKYPETSVGWYRRTFTLEERDKGKNIRLIFDGIFRDGEVWVNGIWLGRKESGYISHDYDISPYLFYDGRENLICVRSDATFEEGWFYEGAGIYRHAWLVKTEALHLATGGVFAYSYLNGDCAEMTVEAEVANDSNSAQDFRIEAELLSPSGELVACASTYVAGLLPRESTKAVMNMRVESPELWDINHPALYSLRVKLSNGDELSVRTGIRELRFDADKGLFLNGRHIKLKGFNMHQDHAGVGSAMPDGLLRYRISRLKWMGANAYRASHNPSTPELLEACDEMGILVIEENRLPGINPDQVAVLEDMIRKGRNHPCIISWSICNEEWGLEWDERSIGIGKAMTDICKRIDPTRPVCAASSSGPQILLGVDIAGYNYMRQHNIDSMRKLYPKRIALGTEETSGCGTRGVYFDDIPSGRMAALNRHADSDGYINRIERGWKFYDERDYLAGVFFWTGFDYRGEPNPLSYPATGSSFGILDYCGFPKDEAYYLKSWWLPDEPVCHILPHWNLEGHEGEEIDVWVYGNCHSYELIVNGRRQGRKVMPKNGHLSWKVKYAPGQIEAVGYDSKGKKITSERLHTALEPAYAKADVERYGDINVLNVSVYDKKGHFVPTACIDLNVRVSGDAKVLGWGNGDSAFKDEEQIGDSREFTIRSFNGHAQIIIRSTSGDFNFEINN